MATSSGNRGRGTRTIKIKVEALVRVITYTYVSYIKMEALRETPTRFTKMGITKYFRGTVKQALAIQLYIHLMYPPCPIEREERKEGEEK